MWRRGTSVLDFQAKQRNDLIKEIEEGKCLLKVGVDGKVVRLVSVAVLILTGSGGQELMEIGQFNYTKAQMKPTCKHPGKKILLSHRPEDVVNDVIEQELTALSPRLTIEELDVTTSVSMSVSSGLLT